MQMDIRGRRRIRRKLLTLLRQEIPLWDFFLKAIIEGQNKKQLCYGERWRHRWLYRKRERRYQFRVRKKLNKYFIVFDVES